MVNIHNYPGDETPGATKLSATDKSGEDEKSGSPLTEEALELAKAEDAGDTPGGKQAEWSTFTSKTTREGNEKH